MNRPQALLVEIRFHWTQRWVQSPERKDMHTPGRDLRLGSPIHHQVGHSLLARRLFAEQPCSASLKVGSDFAGMRVVPAAAEARAGHHSAFGSVPSSSARRSRPVPLVCTERRATPIQGPDLETRRPRAVSRTRAAPQSGDRRLEIWPDSGAGFIVATLRPVPKSKV